VNDAARSDFDKERVRLKEKEVRRNKYSKYIYELALPIELDRQELKREAARLRLMNNISSHSSKSMNKRVQLPQSTQVNS
jgi:hypothetical protein